MKATECFHTVGQRHASLLEKKKKVLHEKRVFAWDTNMKA